MHAEFKRQLNRVAETHFYLRPILVEVLKTHIITAEGRKHVGGFGTYWEHWVANHGDRFFDMGTLIRLGTAIENCLRWYYMAKKQYTSVSQLKDDPGCPRGVFLRLQPWQDDGVIHLYRQQLGLDLGPNPDLPAVQEALLHRHLYAHHSGLLNDDYIANIRRLTGTDLAADPGIAASYPHEDVYWFEPLGRIGEFIEASRRFFGRFS